MKKMLNLVVLVFLFACDLNTEVEDCSLVLCAGDISTLNFEVIDASTDENVFVSGRYTIEDVSVTDTNGRDIPISLVQEFAGQQAILLISDQEWEIGSFNYRITLGTDIDFEVMAEFDRDSNTGCCGNRLFVSEVEVNGISHQIQEVPQLATIFLE